MTQWQDLPIWHDGPALIVVDATGALAPHPSKTYRSRGDAEIDYIWLHHTAGQVIPGLAGLQRTHAFCQASKRWIYKIQTGRTWRRANRAEYLKASARRKTNVGGRGWAGVPYHFWVPHLIELDDRGRMVVYMANAPDRWAWHTGGKDQLGRSNNRHGLAVVMQGCFPSQRYPNRKPRDDDQRNPWPSAGQLVATSLLLELLVRQLCGGDFSVLSTHSRAGTGAKLECPGYAGEVLVDQLRVAHVVG